MPPPGRRGRHGPRGRRGGEAGVQFQGRREGPAGVAVVAGGAFDHAAVVEEGGIAVAGGRRPAGVGERLLGAPAPVQRPGEGVRGVHTVPAVPFGAGRSQGRFGVAVVGGGERGVEVGVDPSCAGEGGVRVDEGVLLGRLRTVAVGAPGLVQLAESDQRAGQRGADDDLLQRPDRARAVAARGLGAGPSLQRREVVLVGGEGTGEVGERGLVVALVPGELAECGRHVRHVGGRGRAVQGPFQHLARGPHVAAQLSHVRVPREDGHPGRLLSAVSAASTASSYRPSSTRASIREDRARSL